MTEVIMSDEAHAATMLKLQAIAKEARKLARDVSRSGPTLDTQLHGSYVARMKGMESDCAAVAALYADAATPVEPPVLEPGPPEDLPPIDYVIEQASEDTWSLTDPVSGEALYEGPSVWQAYAIQFVPGTVPVVAIVGCAPMAWFGTGDRTQAAYHQDADGVFQPVSVRMVATRKDTLSEILGLAVGRNYGGVGEVTLDGVSIAAPT